MKVIVYMGTESPETVLSYCGGMAKHVRNEMTADHGYIYWVETMTLQDLEMVKALTELLTLELP